MKHTAALAFAMVLAVLVAAAEPASVRLPREPGAGLLYYAKADYALADNQAVLANPHITGALFQVIWGEVEKENGVCDWRQVDQWIAPWLKAGKKVALRVLWSTSGYWPKPYYKTPTPVWVWQAGAKFALHKPSGTEIPLIWDPVYKRYAWRFLEQCAARYDGNASLLFVDVTPGAETNPYRFGTIDRLNPEFKTQFAKIKTSDGRTYSDELWLATIKEWVDAADRTFRKTPLLVTLNKGGLQGGGHLAEIGNYCVSKKFYVGQNGLGGHSYRETAGGRASPFVGWSRQTKLFFEMAASARGDAKELMAVMQAAERIRCSYLNVYPEDVLSGTRGQPEFDPACEKVLAYGAAVMSRHAKSSADSKPNANPGK
ncbi:MAG: hypothetical protein EPN23_08305 [Verrucomicrobia bacterium]|nr:MAG: hypothetical protein EPN23_08305 [Verrucomicrobiota bacterium]